MATAVLSTAGNAIAPGIGGVIGGIIGGFIDGRLISKRGSPIEGPRLDDLRIQLRSEGSPLARVHGRRVRIAGTVIWGPPLTEVPITTTSGSGPGKGTGGSGQTTTSFQYYLNACVKLADVRHLPGGAASALLKLWANNTLIFDSSADQPDDDDYDALRFFDGNASQSPDSLIVSFEGADTPAYRGSCGFTIERLLMDRFGTSVNFEALIEPEATAPTVATVIARELELGGLTSDEYDVSGISSSKVVDGLAISGPQEPAQVIAALQTAYSIVHSDWGGKLRFVDRGAERTVSVSDSKFMVAGDSSPSPVKRKRHDERDLPSYVHVSFFEASCDYQQSSRSANAQGYRGQGSEDISMPLVLTGLQASEIAHRAIWTTRGSLTEWEAWLPPSFSDLSENEILKWTDKTNRLRRLRVLEVSIGGDHSVQAKGVIEQLNTFDQSDAAVENDRSCVAADAPSSYGTGLQYILYSGPPLTNNELNTPGMYRAWADDINKRNSNRRAYNSFDDSAYGTVLRNDNFPNVFATLVDALPAIDLKSIGGRLFDKNASFRISVKNDGTSTYGATYGFITRTEDEVAAGANALIVQTDDGGYEILSYTTVDDLGSGVLRLTGLLRALRGTESHALSGASVSNPLCSANELSIQDAAAGPVSTRFFIPYPANSYLYYDNVKGKATLGSEDITTKPAINLGVPGSVCLPLAPIDVEGRRNDAGDLKIVCRRRPRAIWDGFLKTLSRGGYIAPTDIEAGYGMEFDVYYSSVLVRTLKDPMTMYDAIPSDYIRLNTVDWTSLTTLRYSGYTAVEYTAAMHVEDSVPLFAEVEIKARHTNKYGNSPYTSMSV